MTRDCLSFCSILSLLVANKASKTNHHVSSYYFVETLAEEIHNLQDAISEDRRLTERNILRWAYQLILIMTTSHRNFVTLGKIPSQYVTLRSDYTMLKGLNKWNERFVKYRKAKFSIGKIMDLKTVDKETRNIWIDWRKIFVDKNLRMEDKPHEFSILKTLTRMISLNQLTK
jgi:DNA polymerase III delta subunit